MTKESEKYKWVILPPPYSCAKCSFFLHKSCVKLPRKSNNITHLTKTHYARWIVTTSICLQRITMKMSKHLFFLLFSQLGACNHDSSAYQGLEAYPDIFLKVKSIKNLVL